MWDLYILQSGPTSAQARYKPTARHAEILGHVRNHFYEKF